MLKQLLFLLSFFILLFSCKKEAQQTEVITKKPEMSIAKTHKNYSELKKEAESKIKDWKEYNNLEEFIPRFSNASPNEALSNATEFKDLVKKLKDSIRIEDLKTPAFKARVNVLENEALRLADMTLIPAISADEVNNQVDKIFTIYSSLNDKINTVYDQKRFERELDLDSFFKLDVDEKKKRTPTLLEERVKRERTTPNPGVNPKIEKKKRLFNGKPIE